MGYHGSITRKEPPMTTHTHDRCSCDICSQSGIETPAVWVSTRKIKYWLGSAGNSLPTICDECAQHAIPACVDDILDAHPGEVEETLVRTDLIAL